jgi:hypothetical protein
MAFPYLQDILDQPEALQRTLDGLKGTKPLPDFLSTGKIRRVVLTGMGSSFHALHLLQMRLVERGLSTYMIETSELIHYGRALIDPHSLIVAVSQSGLPTHLTASWQNKPRPWYSPGPVQNSQCPVKPTWRPWLRWSGLATSFQTIPVWCSSRSWLAHLKQYLATCNTIRITIPS